MSLKETLLSLRNKLSQTKNIELELQELVTETNYVVITKKLTTNK